MDNLKDWLKKCEGYSPTLYKCTAGKLTIGWGHNIEDLGIPVEAAEMLLDWQIDRCRKKLSKLPWYYLQPPGVQDALLNMCFNLGLPRLLGFKKMIAALEARNYTLAAKEALNSKWAQQVGNRAKDVALMIKAGV